MIPTSTIAAHLTSLLGSEHVRQDANTITAAPADTQQISTLLSYANQHRLTITPIGGGTKQSWGNPVSADILLDTTRLNRVLEHPWQDLTCTVQAGCTWSAMQQTLAQHNQFVALDPLWPDRATVGGIVATNDSGALRHRYGSLRDLIIGMTIVLADGTIAKTGGKVVKNVAGYDLHKLMTGAFGTLGIIAEVTFRLHPLPLHTQTFTAAAPQAALLAPLIAAIRDSHLLTQALQLRGDSTGFHLDIQLNAHPTANQPTLLASMVKDFFLKLEPAPDEVWKDREQVFANAHDGLVVKITAPPTELAQIAHDAVLSNGSIVAQSLGIAYVNLPIEDDDRQKVFELVEGMHVSADCAGGTLLLLHAPERYANDFRRRIEKEFGTVAPSALPLMREIKHQFDPNRTLNPNRFLGGI
jgi:glycolate oxidase FAD binding subunit